MIKVKVIEIFTVNQQLWYRPFHGGNLYENSMLLTRYNKYPPFKIPHHRRQFGSKGLEHFVVEICSKRACF
jgi:hypothetical protein